MQCVALKTDRRHTSSGGGNQNSQRKGKDAHPDLFSDGRCQGVHDRRSRIVAIKYTTCNASRGEGSTKVITSLAIALANPLDCIDAAKEIKHPIDISNLKSTSRGTSAALSHPPIKKSPQQPERRGTLEFSRRQQRIS